MAVSAAPFYFKLYATVLNHFRRARPFYDLAKASSRINVHTINYSLIHFGVSKSMVRFRIDIFAGPRNLPTTTAVRAADNPTSCFRFLAPYTLLLDS
jgi:hypothetical protein